MPLLAVTVAIVATAYPAGAPARTSGPAPIRCVVRPTVTEDQPPTCPVEGKTVTVKPISGVVFITAPGGPRMRLDEPHTIGVSSIIDARHGRYRLMANEQSLGLHYATADFFGGRAQVEQGLGSAATVNLALAGGSFSGCAQGSGRVAVAARGHRQVQHLWGAGKGHFKISGHYAAAIVRGTKWRVTDFCDGSGVTVARGTVAVHDFGSGQVVLVSAGHSYFAPAKTVYIFPTQCPAGNVPLGSTATINGVFTPPNPPSPQVDYRAPSGATTTHALHPDAAGRFSDQIVVGERGLWTVTVHLAQPQAGGMPASCSFDVT